MEGLQEGMFFRLIYTHIEHKIDEMIQEKIVFTAEKQLGGNIAKSRMEGSDGCSNTGKIICKT